MDTEQLDQAINEVLFPDDTCGKTNDTTCSDTVEVLEIGEHLLIFFIGELLNETTTITFRSAGLEGFDSEEFVGQANDVLVKSSDVAYANLELLEIKTGSASKVINVRGLSSRDTDIDSSVSSDDDFFFISSEANEDLASAADEDFLRGWLDYLQGNLTIQAGRGRNRLMISDEQSDISKGNVAWPMTLTKNSLSDIRKGVIGDIMYFADDGDWTRGVDIWLGSNDDTLTVTTIPTIPGLRTTTTINAGAGNDTFLVVLDEDENKDALFVANGQDGNDTIDCTNSSLAVILFGEDGDDTLITGSGNDVVFGDFGLVLCKLMFLTSSQISFCSKASNSMII